jgi:hypothetical protein
MPSITKLLPFSRTVKVVYFFRGLSLKMEVQLVYSILTDFRLEYWKQWLKGESRLKRMLLDWIFMPS